MFLASCWLGASQHWVDVSIFIEGGDGWCQGTVHVCSQEGYSFYTCSINPAVQTGKEGGEKLIKSAQKLA